MKTAIGILGVLGLIVAIGSTVVLALGRAPSAPLGTTSSGAVRAGAAAPLFQARDLDNGLVDLAALRGRPVWINFWATWCPSCKTEMPRMEAVYQDHRAAGLAILGVNVQESPATIRAWTGKQFSWTFVPDLQGTLADQYRLDGLPTHVFVDRSGRIQGLQVGELDRAQMEAALAPILAP